MTPASTPPVVFIAQLGTGGASWQPVIDRLTTSARTFTYDRPGTGDAPPRPAPNPPLPYSAFADELADLLDQHGVTDPAVVVGHSVGSLIARVFAHRHPGRVAGMVYVDGSIPRLAFAHGLGSRVVVDGDGPDATAFDMLTGEIEITNADTPHVLAAVITRTPGNWHPSISVEDAKRSDPLWTAYQRQLARQHGVPLVVASNAGHQIPTEAPGLVAHVVNSVVEAASKGAPVTLDPVALTAVGGRLVDPCE